MRAGRVYQDFQSWEECVKLRELRALKNLRHPRIVRLREMILDHNQLYFVFEFLDSNLANVRACGNSAEVSNAHFPCAWM